MWNGRKIRLKDDCELGKKGLLSTEMEKNERCKGKILSSVSVLSSFRCMLKKVQMLSKQLDVRI